MGKKFRFNGHYFRVAMIKFEMNFANGNSVLSIDNFLSLDYL